MIRSSIRVSKLFYKLSRRTNSHRINPALLIRPVSSMASSSPKMLLVFCDGTSNDGNLTSDPGLNQPQDKSIPAPQQYPTNVLRLSRAVKLHSAGDGSKRQIVLYLSGVGSEADFNDDPVSGTLALQAFGTSVASKIRDAYAFLAQNYQDGDEICLFGFSRGAYAVRKVAGMIDRIGLLRRESLGLFFEIWLQLYQKKTPIIPPGTKKPRIKCVGIWETVGAVFNVQDALSIKDNSALPSVDVHLHALALHENRKKFLPTLWDQKSVASQLGPNQIFKQVWFAGAHSNVGGSYERHELSDLALVWMVGEIESFINLDTVFIQRCLQPQPEPWGTSQPHNAYVELNNIIEQGVIGAETRLDSGDIQKDATFHESLKYSPTKLSSPYSMITLNDLYRKFGPNWSPNWAPLNDFEKLCRQNWGNPPPLGPIPFKRPSTLLAKL